MTELQPTYGNVKLRGTVRGLTRENAYTHKTTDSGFTFRRISFMVHTSKDNAIPVELFGGKFDKITLQPTDPEKRKKKSNRKQVKYQEDIDEKLGDDKEVFMGVNIGLEQDDDGNNIRKVKFAYDAVKYLKENLEDGDEVFIVASPNYRKYESQGEEKTVSSYGIRNIYTSNSDDEEETSSFEQTIILQDVELDKETKRANVSALIIADKDGTVVAEQFYIDGTKLGKFARKLSEFPFGTEIEVAGIIHNRVEKVEVEEEEELDEWGVAPKGFEANGRRVKELEITKAYSDSVKEERYTHEDLFPPQLEEDPFASDEDTDDPFADSPSEDDVYLEDDDLPEGDSGESNPFDSEEW